MMTQAEAVADSLGAAIHARSREQILALYADDIVVWHASTGRAIGKIENADMLAGVFSLTSELEYVNVRRHLIDGGLVQQHRLVGRFTDGRALPGLEACLVMRIGEDGRITRVEEYFDSSAFAEVWERLATLQPVD